MEVAHERGDFFFLECDNELEGSFFVFFCAWGRGVRLLGDLLCDLFKAEHFSTCGCFCELVVEGFCWQRDQKLQVVEQ